MAATDEKSPEQLRREALFKEYDVVVGQFRSLTDIRFKLLGLLPLGTIGTILFVGKDSGGIRAPVGVFGAVVTVALFIYHQRNDQLYDELVSRAAQIERELGLFDGSFLHRPREWVRLPWGLHVEHGWPIKLVYGASGALWLSFALTALAVPASSSSSSSRADAGVAEAGQSPAADAGAPAADANADASDSDDSGHSSPPDTRRSDGTAEATDSAEITAVATTVLSAAFFFALFLVLNWFEEESSARYKGAVNDAMPLLATVRLSEANANFIDEIARVLSTHLTREPEREEKQRRFARRLAFYLDPKHAAAFLGMSNGGQDQMLGDEFAARVLAHTIDAPARWIFDVYCGRR